MARRVSTGIMADVLAAGLTVSSSCFWFCPASGPTSGLWLRGAVVVSLACAPGGRVVGRWVWAVEGRCADASSADLGISVLREGRGFRWARLSQ